MALEELLELLRLFLSKTQEYLNLLHGRRSFIRYVGEHLPIGPVRRIQFKYINEVQHHSQSSARESRLWSNESGDYEDAASFVLTLADIPWLDVSCFENDIRQRGETRQPRKPRRKTMYVKPFMRREIERRESSFVEMDESLGSIPSTDDQDRDSNAINKINALEDELAKLRLQIANIVTQQSSTNTVHQLLPLQALCSSTPLGSPAPPPPPPPPPPPTTVSKKMKSVSEIIRENKMKNGRKVPALTDPGRSGPVDMTEVLKGLGTVKLKKIARSPGGTPVRQTPKITEHTDPAAIIARALKQKFAKVKCSSPDKENLFSMTPSPKRGRSPLKESPLSFGPHLLKPTKKKRLSTPKKTPLAVINV
ncbi:mitochondrial fission regulator 1-like [Apostichopus japonicus]|uniref:mitochondrial fission regulator 1-like n=1 Tax=Stichopus japonicus TaxID=307972 RepID=UPI003AB78F24